MTSSQTLLVNLLGPLGERESWLLDTLAAVLQRDDFRALIRWEIEFAPRKRSLYLNDQTRVDAYFEIVTNRGIEAVVLELKYTDRFSSRRLPVATNPKYMELASSVPIWHTPSSAFRDNESSQLMRCHALGARILQVDQDSLRTTLLIVSHPLDHIAVETVARYRSQLVDIDTVSHVSLDDYCVAAKSMAKSQKERSKIGDLYLRYLQHESSEALWWEHIHLEQHVAHRTG